MSPDEIRRWFEDNAGPDAGDAAVRVVWKLIDEHKPIGIYEECGHSHRGDEPNVREFDDVGLVCADGLMYEICASCCDWNPLSGQTEHCVTEHDHHHGGVHCMVVYSISDSLGVPGKDRSEPTPAPCPAKGVNHDTRAIVDCELDEGHEGTHQQGDNFWRAGAPEHVLAALRAEVVTPEGTP